MEMPKVLDTDDFIAFAGGTGRDIWAVATAARDGDLHALGALLDAQPDLVHCGHYSWLPRDCYRPLHFAVHANQLAAVEFLLSRGAHVLDEFLLNSINQSLTIARTSGYESVYAALDADRRRRFAYHPEAATVAKAIRAKDFQAVYSLLDGDRTLLDATDETGNAPIHWSILTCQLELLRILAERGANLNHVRFDGQRPIDLVEGDYWFNHQKYGGAKEVQVPGVLIGFLLGLGADYGLCVAIRLGDEVRVRALLDSDPALANQLSNDPSGPSTAGDHGRRRPIVEAAKYGRLEIARVLIKAGADVNLGVPLWSPNGHALFEACARGEVAMARLLLQAGARANVEVESSGDCFSIMKRNEPDIVGALQALLTEYGGIAVNYDE